MKIIHFQFHKPVSPYDFNLHFHLIFQTNTTVNFFPQMTLLKSYFDILGPNSNISSYVNLMYSTVSYLPQIRWFSILMSNIITLLLFINKNMLVNLPFIICYYMFYWYGKQFIISSFQMNPYYIMGYIYYLVLNVVFNYLTNSDGCC